MITMANGLSTQQLKLIYKTFLFENVDEILVEQMISDPRCLSQKFERNEIIYDEAHFRHCLGIVLSGEIRVDKMTPERKKMKMSILHTGECFGAAAMFQERERYATVLTAEKSTQILFLPEEQILWAMRRNYTLTENYIRYLSDRIWFLNQKIFGLTAGTAEQRLALFLGEHCGEDGSFKDSLTDLSRELNIGRASLYRALDTLELKGMICRTGRFLTVIDMEGLRQMALSE